jgi:CubicO group peptidase (beta-lactamase class C family)
MKRFIAPFFFVYLIGLSCVGNENSPQLLIANHPRHESLDSLINAYVRWYRPVGFAIGIIDKGTLIYAKGFGVQNIEDKRPVTPGSVFHMASVSKLVATTGIMQLVEKGQLDIDSTVVHYLPYFTMDDSRYKNITIRHILTHTSGIPDVEDEEDYGWEQPEYDSNAAERFVKSLATRKLRFTPAEKRSYSNNAFNILPDVVSKVTGLSFEEYMETYVFRPLNMNHTTFLKEDVSEERATSPHEISGRDLNFIVSPVYPYSRKSGASSNLHTSIEDMCAFSLTLLNGGSYDDTRILEASTIERMGNERLGSRGYWEFQGRKALSHSGNVRGFNSYFIVLPADSIAVVAMSNCDHFLCTDVSQAAIKILFGTEPEPVRPALSMAFYESVRTHGIEQAIDSLRYWLETKKDQYKIDWDNIWFLGWRSIQQGQNDVAIEVYKYWYELWPNSIFTPYCLGKAYMQKGDDKSAAMYFQRVLDADPDYVRARMYLEQLESHE